MLLLMIWMIFRAVVAAVCDRGGHVVRTVVMVVVTVVVLQ